ncbi:hypothetical protein [Crenothrix polyspora]|uniref:Dicarboxylate transport domain-containing protein n=1 Tax=Crenothrix polyspora TaxID=360316 RepID=A0A1R4HDL4_9GAMM|nr:hypothetical protein [Crenothrix polyspora]SJM94306.1 conserved exported hypothetical protein [Crenothrix polyspora]
MQWIKGFALAILLLAMPLASAFNHATLKIDSYTSEDWQLAGISIGINNVNQASQQLALSIATLKLPKPFDDIRLVNIVCAVFAWKADEIVCRQGHAQLQSKYWQSPSTDFAFSLNKHNSSLSLSKLKIADGTLQVHAIAHDNNWQITVDGKNVDTTQLQRYLPALPIVIDKGRATIKLSATGVAADIKQLKFDTALIKTSIKSNDGQFSTDTLDGVNQLTAHNNHGMWHWQNHVEINKGALYADPVHFKVAAKPIMADANGLWNSATKHVTVQSFAVKNINVANSAVFVQATLHDKHWQVAMDAKNIDGTQLKQYFPKLPLQFKTGTANLNVLASGVASDVQQLKLNAKLLEATVQNAGGQFATEKLTLTSQLTGQNNHGIWQWQNNSQLLRGALYVDPVYVEVASKPIRIDSTGVWNAKTKTVSFKNVHYQHPETGVLSGAGVVSYSKQIQLNTANFDVTGVGLQNLFTTYITPFFDPLTSEGVNLEGTAQGQFVFAKNVLTDAKVNFAKLTLKDNRNRLRVKNGAGVVNWSSNPFATQVSTFSWRQLFIGKLPIGAASVALNLWGSNFRLLQPAQLPFLGGIIAVNQLSWYKKPAQEPDISLSGRIDDVSLEKLSRVMQWTPLAGKISGHIPGVSYHNNTLRLGGQLSINAFDGNITLTNLASEGLFSDYPLIHSDFVLDNLDLDQITRKFSFGSITGKVSGYVKELTLENWHPTHFFAWLGTPDNDKSSHRISQKAVQNIASIGGGGATDILSRSFLTLFDTFGYDKIGVGCYLNKGVCQMMGVETTPQGYYLIRGGGLPRIDVMGYNPQVDWEVLVDRLGRISSTEEVIVK